MTPNTDPRTKYATPPMPKQQQGAQPGHTGEMSPAPDHGEETYVGSGKLEGHRAIITGGDSGIGRAVAIAFAREGADVAISYLPEEEAEAQQVRQLITDAGKQCILLPGDLRNEDACIALIRDAAEAFGDRIHPIHPPIPRPPRLRHDESRTRRIHQGARRRARIERSASERGCAGTHLDSTHPRNRVGGESQTLW